MDWSAGGSRRIRSYSILCCLCTFTVCFSSVSPGVLLCCVPSLSLWSGALNAVFLSPAEHKQAAFPGWVAGVCGHRWKDGPWILTLVQQPVFSKPLLYTGTSQTVSKTWNPDFPSWKGLQGVTASFSISLWECMARLVYEKTVGGTWTNISF